MCCLSCSSTSEGAQQLKTVNVCTLWNVSVACADRYLPIADILKENPLAALSWTTIGHLGEGKPISMPVVLAVVVFTVVL